MGFMYWIKTSNPLSYLRVLQAKPYLPVQKGAQTTDPNPRGNETYKPWWGNKLSFLMAHLLNQFNYFAYRSVILHIHIEKYRNWLFYSGSKNENFIRLFHWVLSIRVFAPFPSNKLRFFLVFIDSVSGWVFRLLIKWTNS